ncbi:MAG: hydroxymethylpyrimidine/phosphomethylpyrimidine kinase [Gammaproteobacteria bacterium]|nr:hydroxymethylpyrimidine/phosphomethylpyrimidine kinase [Gammaproteobacteria bacterium]
MIKSKPSILCFSGHDPSGGAGIQADIETIASLGCHAISVITALTAQNTQGVDSVHPVDALLLQKTVDNLLSDVTPAVIKIGLIGSSHALDIIIKTIKNLPEVPVILDPVLASGSGNTSFDTHNLSQRLAQELLPLCTLVTPNTPELLTLSHVLGETSNDIHQSAFVLNTQGCDYVLATGTHSATEKVHNELFFNQRLLDVYSVERLPHQYHGSGCTIASAISAMLAFRLEPLVACKEAIDFTFGSLQSAFKVGQGQLIPNRLFWSEDE